MPYETLLLDQQDAVLTITVDDAVKVVIVAGAGKHFSAGRDIGSPQEKADRPRRHRT